MMLTVQQTIDLVKSKILGTRKGSKYLPNCDHSLRVYESLKKHGFDEDTQMAGLLHDIIEDGGMTLKELRELGYSNDVLHLVDLSTHDSLVEDKFERWQKMLARLMQEDSRQAWAVKLADISDNLTECHLMPKPEKKERFLNKKCPVFVYYGNKYFGGTELYNEFLERYYEQMKRYNNYFPIGSSQPNERLDTIHEGLGEKPRGMKGWNAKDINKLFSLAYSLTEDPEARSRDYKCLFYKGLSFNYAALAELDMIVFDKPELKKKLTGLIDSIAEHNHAIIPQSE